MVDASTVQSIRLRYDLDLFVHVTGIEPRYSPVGEVWHAICSIRYVFVSLNARMLLVSSLDVKRLREILGDRMDDTGKGRLTVCRIICAMMLALLYGLTTIIGAYRHTNTTIST